MQHFQLPVREGSPAVLTAYLHDPSPEMPHRALRPAMLVLPGGGYMICSDREAEPIALEWFGRGYNAFVLRYTLIDEAQPAPLYRQPLLDAAAAMALLRQNAQAWQLQAQHIAVTGFSAGGHLAACLGVHWNDPDLPVDARPNALVLGYPVISTRAATGAGSLYAAQKLANGEPDWEHYFACEENVTADTPPTFLFTTFTDGVVDMRHSLAFAQALKTAGVPCELHLFDHGDHGYSLAGQETAAPTLPADPYLAVWRTLAAQWLNRLFAWSE